ncbi:MAG: hypothetical protein IJ590_01245 [Rickettsiales bacterium]|nr:hypothetical protein [Rickettsiales bacterium]
MFKMIKNFFKTMFLSIKGAFKVAETFLKPVITICKIIHMLIHMIYELFIIAFIFALCFAGYKVYQSRNILSDKVTQVTRTINNLTGTLSKIGDVADTGKALAKTGEKLEKATAPISKKLKGLL